MYRFPLPRLGRFVLLAPVTTISCGGKPQVQILPGYRSASLKHILILPVTGEPDVESGFMTSIISKTFEAQGHYQVVAYHTGHPNSLIGLCRSPAR